MKGFFYEETPKATKDLTCESCGLYRDCKSPKMSATGEGKKDIFILAESPGQKENEQGTQLVGKSGQKLRSVLTELGIDLDRDCRKMNAINCFPDGRKPKPFEIDCCRPRVWKEIEDFKPKLIILLGNEAANSLYGHRWKKNFPGIMALRGGSLPDRDLGCWVCPTFHPSFVIRSEKIPTVEMVFRKDLRNAILTLNKPFPKFKDDKKYIKILRNENEVIENLEYILNNPPELLSIDFETSGLKPHKDGHFIYTCSMSWFDKSYKLNCIAFVISENVIAPLVNILGSSKIKKTAHNLAYEEMWSRVIFKQKIAGWKHDSMIAAHVLNNRGGVTGLKFQALVRYGVVDYASHIEEFIESSDEKDGNSFNRIKEAPIDELLLYNGYDSLYGLLLSYQQIEEMEASKPGYGYSLMHDGIQALVQVEHNGVHVHENYCKEQIKITTKKIEQLEEELKNSEDVKQWKKRVGENFKLTSNQQLQKVLYDDLKLQPIKLTKGGGNSVSKDVLEKLSDKAPFVKQLVQMKELKTARDTYLKAWLRESVGGTLHPMFSLAGVATFRSCVAKGTLIEIVRDVSKYPKGIPIEQVKVGDLVYCYDNNCNLTIKKVKWAGQTGIREVLRIHWHAKEKHGYLDITPEHRVRLVSGEYVEAKNLKGDFRAKAPKIQVLALGRVGDHIYPTGKREILDHRFVYNSVFKDLDDSFDVHHKDENRLNNNPSNLEKLTSSEHSIKHNNLTDKIRKLGNKKFIESIRLGKIKFRRGSDTIERKWSNQFRKFIPHNHCIERIEYINICAPVYDLEIEDESNFIANEICVHNSCSRPNLQNVPVRDPEKQKMLRSAILPTPENQLMEADFKGVEVCASACVHKDPVLIDYIKDKTKDMHRDMAMELFILPSKEMVSKEARHASKNGFVFPEFYGDYYGQIAPALWDTMQRRNLKIANQETTILQHLKIQGIKKYPDFEDHVKKIEHNFWNKRFKVYNKWKWDYFDLYLRRGYLETLTGFRCSGPLDKKQVCNYPIQSIAFHCLLWSLTRLVNIAEEEQWKSKIVLQIHDSAIFDLCPPEREMVIKTVKRVASVELPEHFSWICVPMSVDLDITPINGSWYEKEAIK